MSFDDDKKVDIKHVETVHKGGVDEASVVQSLRLGSRYLLAGALTLASSLSFSLCRVVELVRRTRLICRFARRSASTRPPSHGV